MERIDYKLGECENADFFVSANIEHAGIGGRTILQPDQRFDGIIHKTKRPCLPTVIKDTQRFTAQRARNESWKHHAECSRLTGTDSVE
jgi:hypothetical protein